MRGEQTITPCRCAHGTGPSPRARGAAPESYGETSGPVSGPSPRARGAVPVAGAVLTDGGTIPACAGSRVAVDGGLPGAGDHPRVRGEQPISSGQLSFTQGPSPRARGAVLTARASGVDVGTIPACAGSSRTHTRRCPARRDHPRVRGEQPDRALRLAGQRGPSPRARGAGRQRGPHRHRPGTIPACAGSRARQQRQLLRRRDHPRVRGEQSESRNAGISALGPSPRARGAGSNSAVTVPPRGTIPACAGSSCSFFVSFPTATDHPRVRGEQFRYPGRPG